MMSYTNEALPAPIIFLREPEVRRRTGFSTAYIAILELYGRFPRRVPIGDRAVGWIEAEIEAWQRERISLRDDPVADDQARLLRMPCSGTDPPT
jgi:prophage regulatory protein